MGKSQWLSPLKNRFRCIILVLGSWFLVLGGKDTDYRLQITDCVVIQKEKTQNAHSSRESCKILTGWCVGVGVVILCYINKSSQVLPGSLVYYYIYYLDEHPITSLITTWYHT